MKALALIEVENDTLFVSNGECEAVEEAINTLIFDGRKVFNESCIGHIAAFDGNADDGYNVKDDEYDERAEQEFAFDGDDVDCYHNCEVDCYSAAAELNALVDGSFYCFDRRGPDIEGGYYAGDLLHLMTTDPKDAIVLNAILADPTGDVLAGLRARTTTVTTPRSTMKATDVPPEVEAGETVGVAVDEDEGADDAGESPYARSSFISASADSLGSNGPFNCQRWAYVADENGQMSDAHLFWSTQVNGAVNASSYNDNYINQTTGQCLYGVTSVLAAVGQDCTTGLAEANIEDEVTCRCISSEEMRQGNLILQSFFQYQWIALGLIVGIPCFFMVLFVSQFVCDSNLNDHTYEICGSLVCVLLLTSIVGLPAAFVTSSRRDTTFLDSPEAEVFFKQMSS